LTDGLRVIFDGYVAAREAIDEMVSAVSEKKAEYVLGLGSHICRS